MLNLILKHLVADKADAAERLSKHHLLLSVRVQSELVRFVSFHFCP